MKHAVQVCHVGGSDGIQNTVWLWGKNKIPEAFENQSSQTIACQCDSLGVGFVFPEIRRQKCVSRMEGMQISTQTPIWKCWKSDRERERESWTIRGETVERLSAGARVWDRALQSDTEGLGRTCSHAWPQEHRGFVRKNVVFITAHFFWGWRPTSSVHLLGLCQSISQKREEPPLACTPHL